MVRRLNKKVGGLIAVLLIGLSSLLSACSSTQTQNAAVSLPPVQIKGSGQTDTALTATLDSSATATPIVLASSGAPRTANSNPAVVTSTPVVVANTASPSASPTLGPTPTPTLEGALVKVDKVYELKLIKTAYDALLNHLFKAPNTSELLTASLQEVASITHQLPPTVKFGNNDSDNWNLFSAAFNKMIDSAVTTLNFSYPKGQLAHRAVTAMATAVNDEHTYFMDKEENQQRNDLLQGDNTSIGFGIVFTTQESSFYIVRVIPNSPADKAGLKAGDEIVKFDGIPTTTDTKNDIRATVENSIHTFIINRPGQSQLLTIKVTKAKYTMPTVEYRLINNHIGYIAIRDFFTNVASETDKAMSELYKQGANSWIIDVRDDPGGVDAEEVVGRFVKGDQVMGYDINRKDKINDKVSNSGINGPDNGKPFSPQLPVVMLVNENSASSSEIVALAVRDFKLGPLVGEKTIGALGHTEAFQLGDETAISVTVDEYVSVKQEKLNGVGVTPDVIVPISMNDLASNRDPQLVAAVNEVEKKLAKAGG